MLQRSQPAYVSPLHAVDRVRIKARGRRSRPDFVVLYAVAAIAGMASGLMLTIFA
jgi:hypothetical protein